MRVRVDYNEFKLKAGAGDVYYMFDDKATKTEAPLFFARALVNGVTLEYWSATRPASWDADFPAAVVAINMEE